MAEGPGRGKRYGGFGLRGVLRGRAVDLKYQKRNGIRTGGGNLRRDIDKGHQEIRGPAAAKAMAGGRGRWIVRNGGRLEDLTAAVSLRE